MYNYGNYNAAGSLAGGALAGFFLVFVLIIIAIYVFIAIINWKLFTKAGKPGWAAIVPIYNFIVMLDIAGFKWYYVFCIFLGGIPFIGSFALLFFEIVLSIKIAKSFGQSVPFGIGIAFLEPIFAGIIAFNKDIKYVGPVVKGDIDFNDLF